MGTFRIITVDTATTLFILWYVTSSEGKVLDAGAVQRKDRPDPKQTARSLAAARRGHYAHRLRISISYDPEDVDLQQSLRWLQAHGQEENFETWEQGWQLRENECSKCGGEGYIPQFSHIQNGVCFQCEGTGQSPGWEKDGGPQKSQQLEMELA